MASYYAPYTEAHNRPPATVYPTPGLQLLASLVSLLGLSILSFCFAKRVDYWSNLWSWRTLKEIPWSKFCVSLIFTFSWAFVFSTAVLQFGFGLSSHTIVCSLASLSCIMFYACSKFFIYLFLIEKVYVVWAPYGTTSAPRFKTPIFRTCVILILPLAVVVCFCILGRFVEIRANDRVCVIGLSTTALAMTLAYDLFMTVVLTVLFVWPLWTTQVSKPIRRIARRTLIASLAALLTSAVNLAIITSMHGRQLGWICLSSCITDVTLNALVIWWVTRPRLGSKFILTTPSLPPISCTATSVSTTPSHHRFSIHGVSTTHTQTPPQTRLRSKTYLLKRPATPPSSKITFAEGPPTESDDEPTIPHILDSKGDGMLDAILEAWKMQSAKEGSLQVTIMTEEPPEDLEQDVADVESGDTSFRSAREKPNR